MAFVTGRSISVDGLAETVRGFKSVSKSLPREVARANRDRTKRIMVPEVQKNWRGQRIRPSVAGNVIAAAGGQAWAGIRVRYKDAQFPFAAGVVFGSKRFGQFRPWVGNQSSSGSGDDKDYIVGAAIRKKGDEFAEGWMDEVAKRLEAAVD